MAAGELSRQTLDGVHPGVAEFDGYRDGVDGDMAGLTQCGRRPGLRRFSGKLACWLGNAPRGPDREHHLPVWDEDSGNYLDPVTGEVLQTWEEALDAIGPSDQPRHVARLGPKFDAQGVLAGSKDANKCIGYLTKYLTKQVADCHVPETEAQRAHTDRLAEALRYEPCSPTCANWLRYGIQSKNPGLGLIPGACKGKAHRPEHCGGVPWR